MIISRAPVRITLGGGGTDLPSYYEKHNGFVLSATINKYVFVCSNNYFYNKYMTHSLARKKKSMRLEPEESSGARKNNL